MNRTPARTAQSAIRDPQSAPAQSAIRNPQSRAARSVALLAPLLAPLPLQALAQAQAPAGAPEGPSLLPMVLALLFVLALIPVSVWLLKRAGGATPAAVAGLRVVAQLPLGTRERLVVVEAGERWLLLGVTAASINRVGTLPKGELPLSGSAASFGALLNAARGRRDAR